VSLFKTNKTYAQGGSRVEGGGAGMSLGIEVVSHLMVSRAKATVGALDHQISEADEVFAL